MPRPAVRQHLPVPIRLGHHHRRWTHLTFILLWLSGALWLAFHYFIQTEGPFGPVPHPLEKWWLRLHGLAMMAGLSVLGAALVHHARRAWQLRKNRILGSALAGTSLWLAATGYALYYFSGDGNEAWLPLLHWIPGLALPLVLFFHIRHGKARTRPSASTAVHSHSRSRHARFHPVGQDAVSLVSDQTVA
jgi:hypothetical protein